MQLSGSQNPANLQTADQLGSSTAASLRNDRTDFENEGARSSVHSVYVVPSAQREDRIEMMPNRNTDFRDSCDLKHQPLNLEQPDIQKSGSSSQQSGAQNLLQLHDCTDQTTIKSENMQKQSNNNSQQNIIESSPEVVERLTTGGIKNELLGGSIANSKKPPAIELSEKSNSMEDSDSENEPMSGAKVTEHSIVKAPPAKANNLQQLQKQAELTKSPSMFTKIMISEPLPLLPKTLLVIDEPVKSGGPVAFLQLQRFLVARAAEVEKCAKANGNAANLQLPNPSKEGTDVDIMKLRENATQLQNYMTGMFEANAMIYCRYGRDYITQVQKHQQYLINNPNLTAPMRQIATYLINIKKMIADHNIESENKDFTKLKTKGQIKRVELPPSAYYIPEGPEDQTLVFESRFESGNLLSAMRLSDSEYDLILQNDINTNGHTQWFFFKIANTFKGKKTRLNLLNLCKPDSLYNQGMKVLCYSTEKARLEGTGWHRVGTDIIYAQNNFKREAQAQGRGTKRYYTLTFTYESEYTDDQCYFAHSYPYTYSDLCEDLAVIQKDRFCQNFFNRQTLCRTLAGNRCDYLTITSKDKDPNSEKARNKKGVLISARVHPGESNSSWMMKGVIDFLVSNTPEAQILRDNFVFKIIPMQNPDGVINGNYRCSLVGQDLNRRWKQTSKTLHPVIFSMKRLVRAFKKEREIVLFCDLHGHSRRKNIFMYGNNNPEMPHQTRVFPYLMSKLCDFFSFEQSRFSVHKTKEATARVSMWKELGIPNVFTMEASFCGADRGEMEGQHFQIEHFAKAGQYLLQAILIYCKVDVDSQLRALHKKKGSESTNGPITQNEEMKKLKIAKL